MRTLNSSTTTRDVIVAFKLATAELKLEALLRALQHDQLALRYRPDQPRAPRGTPIGGQWIDDPASASRPRSAGTTEMGALTAQIPQANGTFLCIYDFGGPTIAFYSDNKNLGCPAISSLLGTRFRINDNYPRRQW